MKVPAAIAIVIALVVWKTQFGTGGTEIVVIEPNGDPTAAATPVLFVTSGDERVQFAYDFLQALGNANPSDEALMVVVAWGRAEDGCTRSCSDGHQSAVERNNYMNTTQPGFNAIGDFNLAGVKIYQTYQDGLQANVHTIQNGAYPHMLHGLQTNDVQEFLNADELGTWGTGLGAVQRTFDETKASWTPPQVERIQHVKKCPVTPTMMISTVFDAVDCGPYGGQKDCKHWGIDYIGAEGTPVTAPFDMHIIALGEYHDWPYTGQYVQGTLPDGDVLYLGHLKGRQPMQVGDTIPCGGLLGYTGDLQHTHVQLAPPGNTGPCAGDGTCLDFSDYYWKR